MRPLTLAEAAHFLRMSRSSLYQRKDIPRYRRPGSRVILFDQDELEAWLKQGRGNHEEGKMIQETTIQGMARTESILVDVSPPSVYHRNARYR